jgi:5'-nucleotidase
VGDPLAGKLVVGISTRALFDLDLENDIFTREGLDAYRAYQRAHEKEVLRPGTGFALAKGLLEINGRSQGPLVEVILLSRNDADSSMRVFNSIEAHRLAITRGAFRGGRDPWPFLPAFHCDLFLSAEPKAVREAIDQGTPAGLVLAPPATEPDADRDGEVRIAFDGDSVLFDDEADKIYDEQGPEAFYRHEAEHAEEPLSPGPFHRFLDGLARLQGLFPAGESPIRTALVTARSAPAHRRVVNTFRAWNIRMDEAYFLGGIDKFEVLSRLRPHIFFDDKLANLERAASQIPSAHVPPTGEQLDLFGTAPPAKTSTSKVSRAKKTPPSVAVLPTARPSITHPAPPVGGQEGVSGQEAERGALGEATPASPAVPLA